MTVHTDFLFSKANRWQSVRHEVQCATSRVRARDYPILFISTFRLCQRTGPWKQTAREDCRIVKKILTMYLSKLSLFSFPHKHTFYKTIPFSYLSYFKMFYKNVFFLKHFILKILSDLYEVGNRTFENYRYESEQKSGLVFTSYFYFCSPLSHENLQIKKYFQFQPFFLIITSYNYIKTMLFFNSDSTFFY